MTDIVNPPAAPTVPPYPALGSANFNSESYTYGSSMPGVVAGLQAIAQATWTNAVAAQERAAAANARSIEASNSASAANARSIEATNSAAAANARSIEATNSAAAAEASRVEASKLNLGNKPAPPTTDNQGQALRAGATYYDTSANKWRVWTGSAWGDGVSAVAGVSSFNGKTGSINETTLAGLGVLNFRADEVLSDSVNLRTVVTSGVYRYNTPIDSPPNAFYSPMLVLRSGDTCAQIVVDHGSNTTFIRAGVVRNGAITKANAPTEGPQWRRVSYQTEIYTIMGSGVMDLAQGTRFATTINSGSSVGLSFSNIPVDAAISVMLEVNFVAGGFTLPPGSIWVNGVVPTLATGKRHLLYFEKTLVGSTTGWYVSALPGFAA